MGAINVSTGLIIFLVLASAIIAIFPVDFFGLYLEPIHKLKSTMFYTYTVLFYFLTLVSFVIGMVKLIRFFQTNKSIKYAASFLLTFDQKDWRKLRNSLR